MTGDGVHHDRLDIGVEAGKKRTFVWALDWPGWCRSGKTELEAMERFVEAGERYNVVIERAGLEPLDVSAHDLYTVETVTGDAGTEFGVPSAITPLDRRPISAAGADRVVRLVEAAWTVFDDVAATAPAELRKGPRGGGRDRDKVVEHVDGADGAYAGVMGLKVRPPDRAMPETVAAMRAAMLDVLRAPSDGTPIAGKKWPPRYAARRIAWHALDHAWEIEDRSEP
jgi:hypothetical protein